MIAVRDSSFQWESLLRIAFMDKEKKDKLFGRNRQRYNSMNNNHISANYSIPINYG